MVDRTYGELWVPWSVNFPEDPKVVALARFKARARPARDLYVQMSLYCKRNKSDGFVPDEQIGALVFPDPPSLGDRDVQCLAEVGLVERRDSGWFVVAYPKRNKLRAQLDAELEAKSPAGTRGAHQRWHAGRGIVSPGCPHCLQDDSPHANAHAEHMQGNSNAMSAHDAPHMQGNAMRWPETETETETEKKHASHAPHRRSDAKAKPTDDPAFDRFWAAYPRRESKPHAQKAWSKAIRDKTDPETIIAAATAFGARCQRERIERQFIAHPATWLNGQRWNDEPTRPQQPPAPLWWDA